MNKKKKISVPASAKLKKLPPYLFSAIDILKKEATHIVILRQKECLSSERP
jgi:hypothetical protein